MKKLFWLALAFSLLFFAIGFASAGDRDDDSDDRQRNDKISIPGPQGEPGPQGAPGSSGAAGTPGIGIRGRTGDGAEASGALAFALSGFHPRWSPGVYGFVGAGAFDGSQALAAGAAGLVCSSCGEAMLSGTAAITDDGGAGAGVGLTFRLW